MIPDDVILAGDARSTLSHGHGRNFSTLTDARGHLRAVIYDATGTDARSEAARIVREFPVHFNSTHR